jgi:lipopolysaccharide biosynthesis glycosyltransferase
VIDQNILTVDLDSALSDVDPTRFKDSYFNTGVRVLQNEKERTGALLSKLYEAAKAPMTAADQSAYNRAFVHGTKALPHTAHQFATHLNNSVWEGSSNVHFVTDLKPCIAPAPYRPPCLA